MGESIVASNKEVKIGEMDSANPALQVSVSFGRFENDSLSWEKWSTFSPNKYLEEVEKCATPGSVAQKKAYFEEHYKKIAARKAELQAQAQEKPLESKSMSLDDQNSGGDLLGKSNGQCSDEANKQETNLESQVKESKFDEANQETEIAVECQNSLVDELKKKIDSRVESELTEQIVSRVECQEKEEVDSTVESSMLNKQEKAAQDEAVLAQEESETLSKGSQGVNGFPRNPEKDRENIPKIKDNNLKLGHSTKSHKIMPANKERTETKIKQKPTSPATKIPQFSTPRASKPTSAPTASSAFGTPLKTGTTPSYSSAKVKKPSVTESKKVAPRSLHMSISLDPSGSDPTSLATTRKSLIMEKMGDKDIVKRAFKTFQSNYYGELKPSTQRQSAASKKVPEKGRVPRVSSLTTPQKENGGSPRVTGIEKKNAKAAPSYIGLKSDERADRRKEFSKKLEEKPDGREVERKYLQTKSKDNRDAEIKKLRQSLNFKATPLPSFYHGQRTSKGPLDKTGTKSDIHR